MTAPVAYRVLCVDDEQRVLEALKRTLHPEFDVHLALGPEMALQQLRHDGPFAVIVTDLRMPGMDGATLLTHAADVAPDTVRILLTGQPDVDVAIEAVNRCRLFRFLLKPVRYDDLSTALRDAIAQHELVVSERCFFDETLRGAVGVLLEMLSLSDPRAFARATRIRRIVTTMLDALDAADRSSIEIAASLSQLGAVSLPAGIVEKLDRGAPLDPGEQRHVEMLPGFTERLLASIPLLEAVRAAIRFQAKNYDGSGPPTGRVARDDLPLGARMLRIATDLDRLESLGFSRAEAVGVMTERRGLYDPRLMRVLGELVRLDALDRCRIPRPIPPGKLRVGMVIARDVTDAHGVLLVGRGHEVTPSLVARIVNSAARLCGPIWVVGEPEPMAVAPSPGSAPSTVRR
jgi:response regulator RpfG family c-di-GMP phosphodiesterase